MSLGSAPPGISRNSLFSDLGLEVAAENGGLERTLPNAFDIPWQKDLLETFLRNQLKLAPAIPLIALSLSLTAVNWYGIGVLFSWLCGVVSCNLIQLYLCNLYFKTVRDRKAQRQWTGMIAASELLQGIFWVLPLLFNWPEHNSRLGTLLVAEIMAIAALRFLMVNNFMPVLIAGTGVMTIGVAWRCLAEHDQVYYGLGGILITLELLFLFVARQLLETARDMVIFRSQKDLLIAELRAARDQAENERKEAEKANIAKSTFLANMSHELRTPLNAILGFSEILQREMFGPMINRAYREYAENIYDSGRYLLGLINDLLDISRIEAGRREIQDEPIDLRLPLEHAQQLLDVNATRREITVILQVAPDVPKVLGDLRSVQQVAINLLANAIKFTPTGGQIEIAAAYTAGGEVQLYVQDNGPGIPPDEVKVAFCAFTRGRQATNNAVEGAGLGLSIVNGIMQLHGGATQIESTLGKGTKVICTFPARRVLSGPRSTLQGSSALNSETQRRLIALTG